MVKYDSDEIVELKYPDNVRKKIGMYLGTAGLEGYRHTLTEILDNSIDEAVAGFGNLIEIKVNTKEHKVSIKDNGRGIPFGKSKDGVDSLIKALTVLHAGGKHSNSKGKDATYKFSSGINGVGASVVQAVSNNFYAKVTRDKQIAEVYFKNGKIEKEIILSKNKLKESNGTFIEYEISVKEDEFDTYNVFESDCLFDLEWLKDKFTYIPFLNPGLELKLDFDGEILNFNKEESAKSIFRLKNQKYILKEAEHYKEHLALISNGKSSKKVINFETVNQLESDQQIKDSEMELTFNFAEDINPLQLFFVNGIKVRGGKQDHSLKQQFKQIINEKAKEYSKYSNFETEDIFSNLNFMFSVKINEPSFSGQTKDALNNPEAGTIATFFIKKHITYWINRLDSDNLDKIFRIIDASKKARNAAEKIKDSTFKNLLNKKTDELIASLGKLTPCRSKDNTRTELFIVEGDSAGGSAEDGRSVDFQAVLPLKGKPLNVLKDANQNKILKNEEIISLNTALGCGIKSEFNIKKLKYSKIILLADADVDGFHISSLVLAYFYKFYPLLIEEGHIFVAVSPLFRVKKAGKVIKYLYSDHEKEDYTKGKLGLEITRFKGLGEMDSDDLWDTTLNPDNRKLIRVTLDDFDETLEQFKIYLEEDGKGNKERKTIIKDYYKLNENIKMELKGFSEEVK